MGKIHLFQFYSSLHLISKYCSLIIRYKSEYKLKVMLDQAITWIWEMNKRVGKLIYELAQVLDPLELQT